MFPDGIPNYEYVDLIAYTCGISDSHPHLEMSKYAVLYM